jgi:hypothetical protein
MANPGMMRQRLCATMGAYLLCSVNAGPRAVQPALAAPACSPSIVRAMELVRIFKREADAYVEQEDAALARAEWSNLVHQVILARQEGGDFLMDCHDGLTVATFTLANVWMLHEERPELTRAQTLAAFDRARGVFSQAKIDNAYNELAKRQRKPESRASPKSVVTPVPSATPDPDEVERQPTVAAFLRDERFGLLKCGSVVPPNISALSTSRLKPSSPKIMPTETVPLHRMKKANH